MDETIDDFQENFKLLRENNKNKSKLTQISKYLSPKITFSSSQTSSNLATSSSNLSATDTLSTKSLSSSNISSSNDESLKLNKKSSSKTSKNLNESKISKYFKSDKPQFLCPICSTDLTKFNETDRQTHVNRCLDKGFAFKSESKFEQNPVKSKETKDEQFKFKNICIDTSLNSTKINQNEDKISEKENEIEPQFKKTENFLCQEDKIKKHNENIINNCVPNCPICGKVLTSFTVILSVKMFGIRCHFLSITLIN
jgi:hypothetical protein